MARQRVQPIGRRRVAGGGPWPFHSVDCPSVDSRGIGPRDAALWSDVFADPRTARERRSEGYADPFDTEEAQR